MKRAESGNRVQMTIKANGQYEFHLHPNIEKLEALPEGAKVRVDNGRGGYDAVVTLSEGRYGFAYDNGKGWVSACNPYQLLTIISMPD